MKLENKLLEQRTLKNNCLAPFDSEFKYIYSVSHLKTHLYIFIGGYPFPSEREICSGSAL